MNPEETKQIAAEKNFLTFRWILLIAGILVVSLLLVGSIAFFVTQHMLLKAQVSLNQALTTADSTIHNLRTEMDEKTNLIQAMRTETTELKRTQQIISEKLAQLSQENTNDHDWQYQEYRYLVTLAHDKMTLDYRPDIAIGLLTRVLDNLPQTQSPHYLVLRQALLKNIMALKALPTVNYEAISLQLTTLTNHIPMLSLRIQPVTPQSVAVKKSPITWRDHLRESLTLIKSFVVIRHHAKPFEPLLTQQEETMLRQNLRLLLQEAHLALWQHNQTLYRYSLQTAKTLAETYFANSEASIFIATLNELLTKNIAPPLPLLTDLLPLLTRDTLNP